MPAMKPVIRVTKPLSAPTDITSYILIEDSPSVTDTIEKWGEVNTFTASDVTLKGIERPPGNQIRNLFAGIGPASKDFTLEIDFGTALSRCFFGYVLPNTLQFDERSGEFSFTAVGYVQGLAVDASNLFKRTPAVWTVLEAPPNPRILRISNASSPNTCDFEVGDELQIVAGGSRGETVKIAKLYPDTPTAPFPSWTLELELPRERTYGAGSEVQLLTPYRRNVKLTDMVNSLFATGGLNLPTIDTGPLPDVGKVFASPVVGTGLFGTLLGIGPSIDYGTPANFAASIWAVTTTGIYGALNPTSGWSLVFSGIKTPQIDATNYGANFDFYGYRQSFQRNISGDFPAHGDDLTFRYYAYDFSKLTSPYQRYILEVNINTTVNDGQPPFNWSVRILKETSVGNTYSWGSEVQIWVGEGSTTSTDLIAFEDFLGIDVDPRNGNVYFSDLTVGGVPGAPITFQLSGMTPAGVVTRGLYGAEAHGRVTFLTTSRFAIWRIDSLLGNVPRLGIFAASNPGVGVTLVASPFFEAVPESSTGRAGPQPHTCKKNSGDGRFYMLNSVPGVGLYLQSYADETLTFDPSYPPALIWEYPGPGPDGRIPEPPYVDLFVWRDPATTSGPKPMLAVIGTTIVYVSKSYSGVIPYADLEGLSCADALGQLSILVNAYYYATQNFVTYFRTRDRLAGGIANPATVNSSQIDDSGMVSMRVQPVQLATALYVRVENEKDSTIFGEAGNLAYRNTNFALVLKCRFVPSSNYAKALAQNMFNYVGAQKRAVAIEHVWDGRFYQIGREFYAFCDGAFRHFQITGVGYKISESTVLVDGIEL